MPDLLFPALLKFWRVRSGRSQLDLALVASISARHLSFLESGRSAPSREMVVRLMTALDVPARARDEALRIAGFAVPGMLDEAVSPAVAWAVERMLQQQEPYPLTVLAPDYEIIRVNAAAQRLFSRFIAEDVAENNLFALVFDPRCMRPFVVDWDQLAAQMIARLHRETLQSAADSGLAALLARVLSYPGLPAAWRRPDFEAESASTLALRLRRDDLAMSFMTTLTTFSAPQMVASNAWRIESYFPLDEPTRIACERLAALRPASVDNAFDPEAR